MDIFAGVTEFLAQMASSRRWIARLLAVFVWANVAGWLVYLLAR